MLKQNGYLEIRTDSLNYFNWTKEVIENLDKYEIVFKKNIPLDISSKYEDRWIKMNKDIWDINIKSLDNATSKKIDYDFSFNKISLNLQKLITKIKSYKKDDFFVRIKKIYMIDNYNGLIAVSLGDFDRAINSYIEIIDGNIRYLGKKLVPTKANIKAHNFLKSLFKDLD